MESISLIFKVLWAPGEALARVAKRSKALAPIVLLTIAGIISNVSGDFHVLEHW